MQPVCKKFKSEYNEHRALVSISDSSIIRGYLPNRQLKLVLAWCELRKDELMQNWELSKESGGQLNKIAPLI